MTEEQDDPFATTAQPSLLKNVLVYTLAEKYGIAEVKQRFKVGSEPPVCDGVP